MTSPGRHETERRLPTGNCNEPGPYDYHCTERPMHDYSCYDASEDTSWNDRSPEDWQADTPHRCDYADCDATPPAAPLPAEGETVRQECKECRAFYQGQPTSKHDLELGCAPTCPCQHQHLPAAPLPAEGETERLELRGQVADLSTAIGWAQYVIGLIRADAARGRPLDVRDLDDIDMALDPSTPRANPPLAAAAGEVRVEWGVRWAGDDPNFTCRSREEAERERDLWNEMHSDAPEMVAEAVSRTTSPWVPVPDDPKEQDR